MWPTRGCCPICCMGKKPAYGVIRLIADKLRLSKSAHPGRRTTRTVATAIRTGLTRRSGRRIGRNRACGQRSNTYFSDEVEIWICEAALPRTEEERASAVRDLRVGQSVSESSAAADSERVEESQSDGQRRRQQIQVEG